MSAQWTTVDIAGKRAAVFDPPAGRPRFGLVFLHPIGQETLADNAVFTGLFSGFMS